MELNRRQFLKGGAIAGAAVALGGAAAGCAPSGGSGSKSAASDSLPTGTVQADFDASVVELPAVTKFDEEKEFDIVVVGAGTAGVPAALSALEEGATVAVLQKAGEAQANGNGSCGIILEESTETGVLEFMQAWREAGGYRMNWDLLKFFMEHSGETNNWIIKRSEEAGFPPYSASATKTTYPDGSYCTAVLKSFGPKPKNHKDLMVALAELAEKKGVEFFYETPAVQLVVEKDGSVSGVVGKKDKKYTKFTAKKAVIIAAGDYQNNESLVSRWSPDVTRFGRKQTDRTGDGILMAMAAGAQMTPVNHAKTMHDMDAQPMMMTSLPFMALDENGKRFMNEDIPMASWDLALRMRKDAEDPGKFFRIFDNDFVAKYNAKASIESLENYIPGFKDDPYNVYPSLIDTHRAETLDELAKELDLDPAALKESVDKWNKACEAGADNEFGLAPDKMKPIDTPPYWGTRQWIRCSAINSGVEINANCQVLDAKGQPIKGLYSVGSGAGDLCGGLEWNLAQGGLCCGSYMTQGRYAAIHAVTGDVKPKTPVAPDEVRATWEKKPQ